MNRKINSCSAILITITAMLIVFSIPLSSQEKNEAEDIMEFMEEGMEEIDSFSVDEIGEGIHEIDMYSLEELLDVQQSISLELNELKIGKIYKILADGREGDVLTGRTEFDSPEVDNEVILSGQNGMEAGKFYHVRIVSASEFDLFAEKV